MPSQPPSAHADSGALSCHEFARLDATQVQAVTLLGTAAAAHDGTYPLSEHAQLHLQEAGHSVVHLWAQSGDRLAGYGQLQYGDGDQARLEVFVDPRQRRRGVGGRIVARAEELVAQLPSPPQRRLELWCLGSDTAAQALAAQLGYQERRRLLVMRRSLRTQLPEFTLPEGLRVRPFDAATDTDGWLAVNAAAFAWHPDQGRWDRNDLQCRLDADWFDASGFLVLHDKGDTHPQGSVGAGLAGFHWTKVHAHDSRQGHAGHLPIGEVFIVGVDPAYSGSGLGRALTLAGLHHLRDQGLADVMLYVESDNALALGMYERLGFGVWSHDVMFCR